MKLIKKTSYQSWREFWLILRYHRLSAMGSFLITIILTIIVALYVKKSYAASGKIAINIDRQTSYLEPIKHLNNYNKDNATLEQTWLFLNSSSVANKIIQQLHLIDHRGIPLDRDKFKTKLNITKNPKENTLKVSYNCRNINNSKLVVYTLINYHFEYQNKIRQQNYIKVKLNLSEHLSSAEKRLQDAQAALDIFLARYSPVNSKSNSEEILVKLNQIDREITYAKDRVSKINRKIINLKLKLGLLKSQKLTDSPYVSSNRNILSLDETSKNNDFLKVGKIKDTRQKLNIFNLRLTKYQQPIVQKSNSSDRRDSSILTSINKQNLSEITGKLIVYEANKKIWLSKLEAWEHSKNFYLEKHQNVSSTIKKQYQDLLDRKKSAQETYNTLFIRLEQLEIINNQKKSLTFEKSSVAIDNNLASWKKEIIVAGGVGLGLILAIATAFTMEYKNPCLRTRERICEFCDMEFLGKIPYIKPFSLGKLNNSQLILPERSALEVPYSIVSEAHKIIYRNIKDSNTGNTPKLITITSAISQEGKSTFAANLAASMAQSGKKVLLIDANFYQPRQHEIWQISNHLGLTDLLKNNVKFEHIIQISSLNLDVITTGFVLGDGLSLLQSETMEKLADYVRTKYDITIFDTPSIDLSPNALTVNKFTDGLILVAKAGITKPDSIIRAEELIEKSQQKVLGLVVNDRVTSL